ncbi:MAG: HIT domain-containing protein [Gammaproteobacteria bacterium]|nr:HIT domain-containing protein [Gammaproteobacteria bacterium]
MEKLLDPQLEADSFAVAHLELSELRLMNNQNVLWLILIPRRKKMIEWIDLSDVDQAMLLLEIKQISSLLKTHFPCDKLNIATLGNVVSQLHVHVIARRFDDAYFPKVPFGLPGEPYMSELKIQLIKKIQALL